MNWLYSKWKVGVTCGLSGNRQPAPLERARFKPTWRSTPAPSWLTGRSPQDHGSRLTFSCEASEVLRSDAPALSSGARSLHPVWPMPRQFNKGGITEVALRGRFRVLLGIATDQARSLSMDRSCRSFTDRCVGLESITYRLWIVVSVREDAADIVWPLASLQRSSSARSSSSIRNCLAQPGQYYSVRAFAPAPRLAPLQHRAKGVAITFAEMGDDFAHCRTERIDIGQNSVTLIVHTNLQGGQDGGHDGSSLQGPILVGYVQYCNTGSDSDP